MPTQLLEQLYDNLPTPVAVFAGGGARLQYANPAAKLLLSPQLTSEFHQQPAFQEKLEAMVQFSDAAVQKAFFARLVRKGSVGGFIADLQRSDGRDIQVNIQANQVQIQGEPLSVLYFLPTEAGDLSTMLQPGGVLSAAFHTTSQSEDAGEAIDALLGLIGAHMHVSRAYVFEEISEEATRNTYEWCAEGITPAIQDLQYLRKEEYSYDVVVGSGMFITNDVRKLSDADRLVLEPQGIKAMCLLPLVTGTKALGYMGLDDCEHYRTWSDTDIELLKYAADMITTLIMRRNTEAAAQRNYLMMRRVSDHIDSIVYVSDAHTYELIFLNKALERALNKRAEELLGKKCYHVLQEGYDEPCDFCPLKKMLDADGNVLLHSYTWEYQNTITKNWYLTRDALFPWDNDRMAHLETATDITYQKKHTEELQYIASMDMLTGIHNREWGYRILDDMTAGALAQAGDLTLVFIDIDGLKLVNDTYGHAHGDKLLTETVRLIGENVRRNDILFRWGGDEFILLLQCKMPQAQGIMTGIEQKLQAYNASGALPFALAFSYGMLDLREHPDESVDTLITRADELMYANKMAKRV